MREIDRIKVRKRENYCCGYCGVHEDDAGSRLTIDHYCPRSKGGSDDHTNLVYCCAACNSFKGEQWSDNPTIERILHPQDANISVHLAENPNHILIGLTDTGQFHIRQLHLNRPELVAYREKRGKEVKLSQLIQEQERKIAQLSNLVRSLAQEAELLDARLRNEVRGDFR